MEERREKMMLLISDSHSLSQVKDVVIIKSVFRGRSFEKSGESTALLCFGRLVVVLNCTFMLESVGSF